MGIHLSERFIALDYRCRFLDDELKRNAMTSIISGSLAVLSGVIGYNSTVGVVATTALAAHSVNSALTSKRLYYLNDEAVEERRQQAACDIIRKSPEIYKCVAEYS